MEKVNLDVGIDRWFQWRKENNYIEEDKLQRWMMFLRNDISQEELEVLINMDKDIKKAEEKLEYLSSDPVTQELYFERERALHEKANLINTGIKQGIKQGEKKKSIEIAKKGILKGLDNETIMDLTELSIEEIELIRKEMSLN